MTWLTMVLVTSIIGVLGPFDPDTCDANKADQTAKLAVYFKAAAAHGFPNTYKGKTFVAGDVKFECIESDTKPLQES